MEGGAQEPGWGQDGGRGGRDRGFAFYSGVRVEPATLGSPPAPGLPTQKRDHQPTCSPSSQQARCSEIPKQGVRIDAQSTPCFPEETGLAGGGLPRGGSASKNMNMNMSTSHEFRQPPP